MQSGLGTLVRYGLWAGLLLTANANRKHFGLPTTWVFHTIGNTLSLLLPELYGALAAALRLDGTAAGRNRLLRAWHAMMRDVVLDNPRYVEYVAPAAAAYLVSHPNFNIYKGKWAERRLLGFGPDSIPHAATAFALTNLIFAVLDSLKRRLSQAAPLARQVRWLQRHAISVSGIVLALLTALYEGGEYMIHNAELKAARGDETKINMMWDAQDSATDVLSNGLGWLLAVLRRST